MHDSLSRWPLPQVPYHHRVAIDTGRRVGLWYTVREEAGVTTLSPCDERKAFGEPRVLAYDIECVMPPPTPDMAAARP